MGVVNPTQSNAGDTIEAADINTPVNQLAAVINGNIDATNLADASVTTSKHADSSVTPAKLLAGTGSSWAWQTWTPTLTNFTLGNGTLDAKYIQIGKTVFGRFVFTLGSTSTMSTDPNFTLPIAAAAGLGADTSTFSGHILDAGVNRFPLLAFLSTGTNVGLFVHNTAGTYAAQSAITSTVPMTWGTADKLCVCFTYEAA